MKRTHLFLIAVCFIVAVFFVFSGTHVFEHRAFVPAFSWQRAIYSPKR